MKQNTFKLTLSLLRPLKKNEKNFCKMRLAIILSAPLLSRKLKEPCSSPKTSRHNNVSLQLADYQLNLKLTFSLNKKQLTAVHILDVF